MFMHCMYTWGGGGEWMSESGRTGEGGEMDVKVRKDR